MTEKTELQKRNLLRLSNQESNAITKECIETALISLMDKKNFNEITITDIIQRAGVSRASYYRNYESKEDILSGYIQSIFKELSNAMLKYNAVTENRQTWDALLKAVKKVAPKYKILLEAGFGDRFTIEYASLMNKDVDKSNVKLYYSNIYWAGAISAVLSEWVRNDLDTDPKEIAEIGSRMMTEGIYTVVEFGNHCE